MADDRRVNMYFSEKKCIDDTIYQYFKDMPNKQDIIKMILFEYVKRHDINSNNLVTKTSQELHRDNTNNSPNGVDKVTKPTHKKHRNVTEKTLTSEDAVTKDAPVSDNLNFDDFITEENVENENIDSNENGFDLKAIMDSMNQYMK